MAIVAGPTTITFEFIDDDLARSTETISMPSGTTAAAAADFAGSYAPLIQAVSDCALSGYNITQSFYDDTFPAATAGSDVEDKGVFAARTANNGTSTLTVPGIKESVLLNTGTRKGTYIDLANAAVAALAAALISGLSGTQPSNRNGVDLAALRDAYKQNRASQRRMGRKG